MKKHLTFTALLLAGIYYSQVGINNQAPKGTLDVTAKNTDGSTPEGFIAPRLTGDQIKAGDAVYGPEQQGMIIYATSAVTTVSAKTQNIIYPGYYYFDGSSWQGVGSIGVGNGLTINGTQVGLGGTLSEPVNINTNNQSFTFAGAGSVGIGSTPNASAKLDVASTNSGFLPPRLSTDQRANISSPAEGLIIYNTTEKCLNYRGSSQWMTLCGTSTTSAITLSCTNAVHTGILRPNLPTNSASSVVSYSNGNGATYPIQSVNSTGVTGLIATRNAGTMTNGDGTIEYVISGTPSGTGIASFAISVDGQTCTFTRNIGCGAFIAPGVWKEFMCHNLGADYNADPFTPAAAIHGAKYQWGIGTEALSQYEDQEDTYGFNDWNKVMAPDGSWLDDMKTSNDPCPSGFKIPSSSQFQNIIDNNTKINIGTTWSTTPTNYSTAIKFGDYLFLPTAGFRYGDYGFFGGRGSGGFYWSSTQTIGGEYATNFNVTDRYVELNNTFLTRVNGMSLRCIKE